MTGRVRIRIGQLEWAASVAGREVTLDGVTGSFVVVIDADGRVHVNGPHGPFTGIAQRVADRVWVGIGGEVFDAAIATGPARRRSAAADEDALTAPMAATVVRINVAEGAAVGDGDTLIALEAMKMELPVRAPRDGVVKTIHCREGELVQQGALLIELDESSS